MLSPDVPEFVPRSLQDLDPPSNTEILSHDVGLEVLTAFSPVPNQLPHPYSVPHHSVNDSYCNWSGFPVHPQPWKETSPICNDFQSQHDAYNYNYASQPDDNWRYGGYSHWNSNTPFPEKTNGREGWRNKSSGRFDEDRSLEKQEKSRLHTSDRISGHHQRNQRAAFGKRKALKGNYNYNQNMKPQFTSEYKTNTETSRTVGNYNKQKTEVQKNCFHSENVKHASGSGEGSQEVSKRKYSAPGMAGSTYLVKSGEGDYAKGRRLPLHTQGNQSRNNVSYKKILNRRKDHEDKTEKTESVISMIPTQSDDQWPMLSGAPHVSSVDERSSSVWVKKDNQPAEQVVWPRPPSEDMSTNASSLNSQEIKSVVGKECGVPEVSDNFKGKDKQGKLQSPETSMDGISDTKERQFTASVRPKEGRVWHKEKKDHTVLTNHNNTTHCNVENTYKSSKERRNKESSVTHTTKGFEKSINNEWVSKTGLQKSNIKKDYEIQKEHGVPALVDKAEVKPSKGDSFETEKGSSLEEVVDTSVWHMQKKKRPKAREQQEDSPSYAKITMAGSRIISTTGGYISPNRHLETQKNFESKETVADSSNKVKGKINAGRAIENESKDMTGAKDIIRTIKNPPTNNRKDAPKNYNPNKKNYITSNLVTQNSGKNLSAPSTSKLEGSKVLGKSVSVKEKDAKEDEAIIKLREERKAKKKQEKMRKRESKLKNAQAVLASDTKVTLISKDVLELLHHDKSQRKTSKPQRPSVDEVSKKKNVNSGDMSFQISAEDYPSLLTVEPKVPKIIKYFAEPGSSDSVQEDPETFHPVDNIHFSSETYPVLKNQNDTLKAKHNKRTKETKNIVPEVKSVRIQEQSESPASEPAVPSYSKALLSAPTSKVVQKAPAEIVVAKKSAVPKKKVKTKDDITFDLLAAVTMKKLRRKDRTPGDVMKVLDRQIGKGDGMKVDLVSATSKNSKIIKNRDRQLAGPDNRKLAKSEVVVKRGKQREGQQKKKLTTLKKAMKRAKQMEIENLISVLQEAKKLQELSSSTPVNDGGTVLSALTTGSVACLPSSGNETSVSEIGLNNNVSRTDNLSATETNPESSCDSEPIGCGNINNGKIDTQVKADRDLENTEVDDRTLKTHSNLSSVPVSKSDNDMEDSSLSNIHNIIDPEFSKKCSEIAEELRKLENPLHKNKFREYCNHMITPEVNAAAKELIQTLVGFQTRHYQRDPVKARIRRRYVCGLRSTTKAMGKLACVIVAPDIARCKGPGALDEVVSNMLSHAKEHGIPIVFALTCRKIGNFCKKNVPVSCIGIINYQGSQDIFHRLMELIPEAQNQYQELVARRGFVVPATDGEFSDEECLSKTEVCVPASQDSKNIPSSNITFDAHAINEDASMPTNLSTREAVIASTVAILVGNGDEESAQLPKHKEDILPGEVPTLLVAKEGIVPDYE